MNKIDIAQKYKKHFTGRAFTWQDVNAEFRADLLVAKLARGISDWKSHITGNFQSPDEILALESTVKGFTLYGLSESLAQPASR